MVVSGCDLLNFIGSVFVGECVFVVIGIWILFEDGVVVVVWVSGKV